MEVLEAAETSLRERRPVRIDEVRQRARVGDPVLAGGGEVPVGLDAGAVTAPVSAIPVQRAGDPGHRAVSTSTGDPVPFLDLTDVTEAVRDEVMRAWQGVLDSRAFVGGPAVPAFERRFAAFCGTAHAVGTGERDGRPAPGLPGPRARPG